MIFEKTILVPLERVGALIGKSGRVKAKIEKICAVSLSIDGQTGEIIVRGSGDDVENVMPFKAEEIVLAIGRGFSPDKAMRLLEGENSLHIIDLREFVGKSTAQIERVKGRIIGEGGRVRKNVEELSGATISVYGRTVAIIGEGKQLRSAVQAITALSNGSTHGKVYNDLQDSRRRQKMEKLQLWEGENIFE
ncbi:MAG: RNA-binding protein [Thaumarchaeota archaeon]|nr:RNA-binding protein [Nitrososphaerota archaeon]